MALEFPTPSELAEQYLQILKSLKPELDTSTPDSDWWIRAQVTGGVISGVYADQRKIADDPFPQSARREALEKHLFTYFGTGFIAAQPAVGDVGVTGDIGTVIELGTEFVYTPNGNVYQSTAEVTLAATAGLVAVESIDVGQSQNLLTGAALTCSTPPAGLESAAAASGAIGGGRNVESNSEAAARILAFIRQPPAGGTRADYIRFAQAGSDQVVDASVIPYILGLGTVGVVITAGTTDVDDALNSGDPVVRTPSDAIIDVVQAYIETVKVLTDCVTVFGPNAVPLDVTVRVRYATGDNTTVDTASGLTYEALVQREVKRAVYKTPPGGRRIGTSGFMLASEIEEVIDSSLSALPYQVGEYSQILVDRQVDDLSVTGVNLLLGSIDMAEPGTITVVEM